MSNSNKKFKTRLQMKSLNPSSNAEALIKRKAILEKNKQLEADVQWCRENNVRGHAAIKTRQYPLIKNRETINRRLDGKIVNGLERQYCAILLEEEEMSIVSYIKNKNRAMQGINKAELTKLVLDVLKVRQYTNKRLKGGRKFIALSANAKNALTKNKLGKSFWMRFKAKNPSLTLKRQGDVSINRALNCTREMACFHLYALAEELIETGIMTKAVQKGIGVYSENIDTCRIFNHDETPQFINFGVDGTPAGLVFAAKRETCCKMIRENRECVTIHPLVSFSGDLCVCQILFGTVGITNQIAPKEAVVSIPHLLITTCNHGVSDHNSLLDMYKEFDEYLNEKKVARPVVLLSDGHCSRFNFDVLKFLQSKNIRMFLTPPDTTGVTQLLDQLNKNLHHEYRGYERKYFY
ncbi:uncharacterized protein LOC136083927 [Hydra vulgaris]|uniref:Uncharacterized protein LOC136083927 n=1 Tax=Hydra vulgaris TaxID=6087 RepID=A0ABM4CE55_HYDVU